MNLSQRYVRFVLNHRVLVLLVCVAITALAGWSVSRGVFASSITKLFFGDSPAYVEFREYASRFGEADVVVVAVEQGDLFTPKGFARLETASKQLAEHPMVRRVQSVADANNIQGQDNELVVTPYRDQLANANPAAFAHARQQMLKDTFLKDLLLSSDAAVTALLIELVADEERPIEMLPKVLQEFEDVFVAQGYLPSQLHFAGTVPESVESTRQARFNIERLLPFTVVVLAAVVLALFGQLWPVFISMGISAISIVWAFGFAVAWDRKINLMLAMVPAVLMIVCLSDIIHLCSAYLLELRSGATKRDAIERSGAEVGTACIYTSITTFLGFASAAFVPTPIFRQLGVVLGLGVGMALLLAMTLVPIALDMLPLPKDVQRREGRISVWTDKLSQGALHLGYNYPKLTVAVFTLVVVGAGVGLTRFEIETSIVQRLSESNPVRRAQAFVSQKLAGTNFVDVYLVAQGNHDFIDPNMLARARDFQERLQKLPGNDRAGSVVDLFSVLHRELAGAPEGELPTRRDFLAQYLLLFEISGGQDPSNFIDEERKTIRMMVRRNDTGFVGTAAMGEHAIALGQQVFGNTVVVKPMGLTYLFGQWIGRIVEGQKTGLLFALFSTTLMMMLVVRSFGAGVASMIPNALPIVITGGALGWLWQKVDSDTMMVGMVAIGIAVDDTIHLLTRLRFELKKPGTLEQALERSFRFAGRAIVQTSIILCLGFLPFATSDYFTTRIMGTLLPLVLVLALLCDLVLVPALLRLGVLRMPRATPTQGSSAISQDVLLYD